MSLPAGRQNGHVQPAGLPERVDPDQTGPEPDRSDTEHDEVAGLLGDVLRPRPFVDCHPDFHGSRRARDPDDERSVAHRS